MNDWQSKPYAPWLENVIRELVEADPVCVAIEMLNKSGKVLTCYYDVSSDDRARLIGGMIDDDRVEFIKNNRELIKEILEGEDGDNGADT